MILAAMYIVTVIILLAIPGMVAHIRKVKFRWVITVLAFVPSYGILWVAALLWAIWPKRKRYG